MLREPGSFVDVGDGSQIGFVERAKCFDDTSVPHERPFGHFDERLFDDSKSRIVVARSV